MAEGHKRAIGLAPPVIASATTRHQLAETAPETLHPQVDSVLLFGSPLRARGREVFFQAFSERVELSIVRAGL